MLENRKNIIAFLPSLSLATLIAAVAWIRLYIQNDYVLYQFQEQKLFLPGWDFFIQTLQKPGGLFTWAGLYLQQFLFYPAIGSLILILIWVAGYMTSVSAFKLNGAISALAVFPVAGLMSSLLCTGYWIYVMKVPEYVFTPSLIYLTATLLMFILRNIRWHLVWQSIICIAFLLFGIVWMKQSLLPEGLKPVFYMAFLPVATLPLLSLVRFNKRIHIVDAICVIGAASFLWFYSDANTFRNDAYKAEMLISRAIEEGRWQDALDYSAKSKVTRQIWMMRQIALMNLGRLGSDLFSYGNKTIEPRKTAGVEVNMVEVGGPLIYFMNGCTQFAHFWSMQNSVEYGISVARLRLFAMCAIVNGEEDLARKYLGILSQTKFHGEWARLQYALLDDPSLISKSEPYRLSSLFQYDLIDSVDGDDGLCERFLVLSYARKKFVKNPDLCELCLNYAMIQRNPDCFWFQFVNYLQLHPGIEIPPHYQQAAVLFSTLEPSKVPSEIDMDSLGLDSSLSTSFKNLLEGIQAKTQKGVSPDAIAKQFYAEFGETYFWYYLFCLDNSTY